MRELDDFINKIQQRAMRDLWDNKHDNRFDDIAWTQKFVFDYGEYNKDKENILDEKIRGIMSNLNELKKLHTEITGHTKFSLLKTSEMSKDLVMTFYYECLECLQ